MTTMIASVSDSRGRPLGRGNRRTDPFLIARMDRVQDAVKRGRSVEQVAREEGVSDDTVYDDLDFLENLHQERLAGAAQERFDFVAGGLIENVIKMDRTYYRTTEPHAQIMATDRSTKALLALIRLWRLEQPTVGEAQAVQRSDGQGTSVTINDNRSVTVGLEQIEAILHRQIEEDRRAIPATTIENYRAQLGADNVKFRGERLDAGGVDDEEEF